MLINLTFLMRREQYMSLSVTNKISCAHSEDIDLHSPCLISVINVHIKEAKVKGYPLILRWCQSPAMTFSRTGSYQLIEN